MNLFLIWSVAYAIPVFFTGTLIKLLPRPGKSGERRDVIIMHIALVVSAFASQYVAPRLGAAFPWHLDALSLSAFAVGMLVAGAILGLVGIAYSLSALIQQLTLCSIAFILLPALSFYIVVLLIVPIFVYCHPFQKKHRYARLGLFALWGIITVALFALTHNVWYVAALHTAAGAIAIRCNFLYTELEPDQRWYSASGASA